MRLCAQVWWRFWKNTTNVQAQYFACLLFRACCCNRFLQPSYSRNWCECENNLHSLFPVSPIESICTEFGEESSEFASLADEYTRNEQGPSFIPGEAVETIYRSTVVALRTIREIRHSSTRSMFSLPPINRFDCDEKFGVVIDEMAITPVAVTQ